MSADDDRNALLAKALASVADGASARWCGDGYRFSTVGGGTQATVWHGQPTQAEAPEVAVRLTPKPVELIDRIARLIDAVDAVERPETLAVARLQSGGRTWTVHVCTWIGKGTADRSDPYGLGQDIARLHQQLARAGNDFADRKLTFERGPVPPADQELPAWYVARHLWRDRIFPRFADHQAQLRPQPIHGDLHWDNVVAGSSGGFGFIDFDKVMHAPPVFDLAKLIATGFFRISSSTGTAVFRQSRATDLLAGYQSIRPLSAAEIAALEGFALILNEETARLGHLYDVATYREQADAVGSWWTIRRRRKPSDPLGIRTASRTPNAPPRPAVQQLPFFPDPNN
ncbi:phosphotransferase [Microbispora sp. NBRC 16548]|uniref:phosphotransferase enzyme family protein n=1 Tax=Microbispora sp. NBRC 16548 TaxID=3030994 RepID=UPI0024A07492|nr:phosphotransferase [Microbispora sp. NBRC 16548]GLX06597.1 hypothetical protein Misp03_35240 [Microbispora sp. NBRC 16548]